MENRTQELLKKCKEAGYEKVAIFCADERVPESVKYEKVANTRTGGRLSPFCWFGNLENARDENDVLQFSLVPHLVCCHPPKRDKDGLKEYPSIWRIGDEMSIRNGGACGDTIKIRDTESLTAGFYDLGEIS